MSRPQLLKRLVTAAVLLSLCSALLIKTNTGAHAANEPLSSLAGTKISPDLRQLILSGNGDARVKVIVQLKSSASPGLIGGLLDTVGGLLVGVLANLNIRIVDVEANNVEVLAADPDVAYISLDNTVRSSGHITTTTEEIDARLTKKLDLTIARNESNELEWFDLDRAAQVMPGPESQRVIQKIARMLHERSSR